MATQTFAYTGRDAAGKLHKGRLEGASEGAVASKLRTMGLSPVGVNAAAPGTGLRMEIGPSLLQRGVSLKDLAVMSRQMATMVSSGLSLMRTLTILAEQTENAKLRDTLTEVRRDVESGFSLSLALAKHPRIFPPLMIHLVRAGETGGFLEESLESAAKTFEADVKLRGTIKSAMTYPIVVLIMAMLSVVAMIIFIVPVFEKMFSDLGGDLPLPTQFLVTLSKNMFWLGPVLLVLIVGFSVWWRANRHTDRVRSVVDRLKLRLPVFGSLFRKIAVARFSRNFGTLTAAGVPIMQSLDVVGQTSGNWVLEQALVKVRDAVRIGRPLASPLADEPVFPPMVTQMIAVGEDAGSLEQMLGKIADFYEAEVQATTEQLTALIEPLMIAFIGVVIGGMIVALYLPVFTIFQTIGGQ
jgi:type IV pilus assembly protein PilC